MHFFFFYCSNLFFSFFCLFRCTSSTCTFLLLLTTFPFLLPFTYHSISCDYDYILISMPFPRLFCVSVTRCTLCYVFLLPFKRQYSILFFLFQLFRYVETDRLSRTVSHFFLLLSFLLSRSVQRTLLERFVQLHFSFLKHLLKPQLDSATKQSFDGNANDVFKAKK